MRFDEVNLRAFWKQALDSRESWVDRTYARAEKAGYVGGSIVLRTVEDAEQALVVLHSLSIEDQLNHRIYANAGLVGTLFIASKTPEARQKLRDALTAARTTAAREPSP